MISFLLCLMAIAGSETAEPQKHFAIQIVDEQTGRGVPLVELRTVHGICAYSDSNGIVAFYEPGLMNKQVYFFVSSPGYEYPKDGFGCCGKSLKLVPGGRAKLTLRRINIAERLYRVTGGGIYRDSLLVGAKVPLKEPALNGLVLGSDSVLNAVYRGKVYWFWGDTNWPSYPLGNFHVPGATSELPARGGLDPEAGVDLRYFLDRQGFAKATAQMPGDGPTWLTTLVPLTDHKGQERLYGSYVKVRPPMKVYKRGLVVFNDDKQEFDQLTEISMKAAAFPRGAAFRHRENDVEYVYFAQPFPATRVRAAPESFRQPEAYETFTCLKTPSQGKERHLDRDAAGRLVYAWRKNTPALGPGEERELIKAGKIKAHEARWQLRDRDTGKTVIAHAGSVYWNAYRRRWTMIFNELDGTSYLGEIWYAEADTPLGPWAYAVKVASHPRYSFYNPKQHPMFDKEGGRVIFFEGTYSVMFSGNPNPTPRYDYNQLMYRLDLADPRLALPVAVYDISSGTVPDKFGIREAKGNYPRLAFFAPDRPFPGSVPVLADKTGLVLGKPGDKGALFYAWPVGTKNPPTPTIPLYEYRDPEGSRRAYSVGSDIIFPGLERAAQPFCLVWRSDIAEQ